MTITINLQNVGASELDDAKALLETLRGFRGRADQNKTLSASARRDGLVVARWLRRLGEGSLRFWYLAAKQSKAKSEWTFGELAAASRQRLAKLRSRHRNSYRAIKAEGADDPLTSRWDAAGRHRVYAMSNDVRDEVLRLAPELLAKIGGKSDE